MSDVARPSRAEFEALLNAQFSSCRQGFNPGERVRARVLDVRGAHVVLDVGAKHEGLVPVEEVRDEKGQLTVQPGETIDAIFLAVQGGAFVFTTRLSGAVGLAGDRSIAQAAAAGLPVEGLVASEVNGGYEVTVHGQRAFCPFSQISLFKQPGAVYIGQKFPFLVQECDEEGRNIVVSRRALLERERAAQRDSLKTELQPGQVRSGVVTRLVDFGFFVDLGGIEGLVPLKEVAWQRDVKPADVVKEGERVEVLIREIDWERERIGLSLRGAGKDPWFDVVAQYPTGSGTRGKVTRIEPFGAFVELAPGVEGLLPIGRLGSGRRLVSPREVLTEGQEIDVQVEGVDPERRRIALRPLDARVAGLQPGNLDVGATVEGIVEGIKPFGVFLRLSESATGLLHIGETDVGPGGNPASKLERAFAPGSKVQVVVKSKEGNRISLTLPARWQSGRPDGEEDVESYRRSGAGRGQSLGSLGDAFAKLKL